MPYRTSKNAHATSQLGSEVENYLGRITKARILGAVREAKGERAAQLIDQLKKRAPQTH